MHAKSQINELKDLTIHKVRDTVTYDDLDTVSLSEQVATLVSGRAQSIDDVVAMSSPAPNPNCPYELPSSSA